MRDLINYFKEIPIWVLWHGIALGVSFFWGGVAFFLTRAYLLQVFACQSTCAPDPVQFCNANRVICVGEKETYIKPMATK